MDYHAPPGNIFLIGTTRPKMGYVSMGNGNFRPPTESTHLNRSSKNRWLKNPKMAASAILTDTKIAICRKQFYRSPQHLARWC